MARLTIILTTEGIIIQATSVGIIFHGNAALVSDDELEGVEYVLVTHEVGSP
jgi:hypothetical protein